MLFIFQVPTRLAAWCLQGIVQNVCGKMYVFYL